MIVFLLYHSILINLFIDDAYGDVLHKPTYKTFKINMSCTISIYLFYILREISSFFFKLLYMCYFLYYLVLISNVREHASMQILKAVRKPSCT